jgi:pSer/pThr/pTyr-binding forkhead associated (FHA) protein
LEPSNETPAASTSVTQEIMARELREKGEKTFRQKYPHPFLVVRSFMFRQTDFMAPKTIQAQPDSVDTQKVEPGSVIINEQIVVPGSTIALIKSDRNAFASKITVGRARNNDIIIREPKVSKLHAVLIQKEENAIHLMDMGSANGTRVNGVKIEKNQSVPLHNGDYVAFYKFEFEYFDQDGFIKMLRSLPP